MSKAFKTSPTFSTFLALAHSKDFRTHLSSVYTKIFLPMLLYKQNDHHRALIEKLARLALLN
jgi:hypothetical protein